jgi:ribosomal protein S18 acetylase RimI-like enzyme
VRRAGPADHAGVTRELVAYFAFLGEELDPGGLDHDVADWQGEYDGVAGVMLVVVDPAGEVVGTAAVRRLEPGVTELKRMWLRPACRGRGLARVLMDRCLEEARALGGRVLRLDSEHKLAAAVRLYRRYGFEEIGDYNRNPRAELWMELALAPGSRTMASAAVSELRKKSDAASASLAKQLQGMEPHLDRADGPGEWTTRQVLCHLLSSPDADPVALLKTFATSTRPVIEIKPGQAPVTAEHQKMTLAQLWEALETQRRDIFGYLETLGDADLARKATIPLFKQFFGTDEIALPVYLGAMFEYHWHDHAGQIAKIRKAVGLPEAG